MSTTRTMTLDELRGAPLTEEERWTIRSAAERAVTGGTVDDPDCPRQTKEELAKFRPWHEVHPAWYRPAKTEIHMRIDTDVLEWFKSRGRGCQTRMNAVLRAHAFG